jgi:hypothetical protein
MQYKKEQCLDDFVVATEFEKLIKYNIEANMLNITRDKHYRGTIQSINGNVADVLLLNASTPIPDVKINTGINLFEDEEVYVLALNGSLNNLLIDSKVLDLDLLYGVNVDNFLNIETFQDYSE